MRVLVFGAGAIGSVVGGMLARAGHEVVLVGRAPHMGAIREKGLHISGIWGEHRVMNLSCYRSVAEIPGGPATGVFDLILVTVKSYDTPEAARTIKPLVRKGTLVLSLQNGYGNVETLEEIIGEEEVLGGRVIFGVELVEPGSVRVTVYAEEVLIGSRLRLVELDRLLVIAGALTSAGIPTKPTQKISEHIWGKVLYNAALNPLGAILRRTYGELAANPFTREIMDCVIAEIFAVAAATGVEMLWKEPEEYRKLFYEKLVPPTASHYPSMMRDIEAGRRTEIDALNGAVVRLAHDAGVIAPVNLALANQVKFFEDPGGEHHWT
jgi:2-dehydropantoate 2-reductase